MRQQRLWLAILGAAALSGSVAARGGEHARLAELLEAHCFDCHAGGVREGELALDELLASEDPKASYPQWRKIWKMVGHGFMPPADFALLSRDERRELTHAIESGALGVDREHPDPGRVTMRRLNRVEYEHTIVDLFEVDRGSTAEPTPDWRLRDLLPPDDTAYGFDNIGDFQTLSPALLERYFEIAERVVSDLIVFDGPWFPTRRVHRLQTQHDGGDESKRTVQKASFEIDEPGLYRVEVSFSLGGFHEYGGEYDFTFTIDEGEAAAEVIDVGGEKTHTYEKELRLVPGRHSVRLENTSRKPDWRGEWQHLTLEPRILVTGPISPDRATYPDSHRRIFFNGDPPADEAERRGYARDILRRVASRAFRRPVDGPTLDRLTDLAMASEDFEVGVGNALVAILTSPRFLFRTELQPQPDDPAIRHKLDEHALASRLSYLLWLSLPDDELTRLAADGRLREELPAQLRRMLADPKSSRFFEDFAGQWLRTRNVLMTSIARDEEVVDPLREEMKRETEMLFEHIARNDHDLMELVTADYTFVDEELAEFYGIDGVEGEEFRRVELSESSSRGGILTHASFLVSTSNPDRTSPVKRGLFVLENLLATQPPAPPANVPPLEEAEEHDDSLRTVRQQLEAHRADPSCAACHAHFDPIGVVLENYDLIGRWRDDERGAPIDPRTTTVTGEELNGISDLRNYIAADRERFYRCCTEKLLTYALGRGLEPYDSPTIDNITQAVTADGGRFSTLLRGVVESPAFQLRRGDDDASLAAPGLAIPETPPPDKRRPERRRRRERREFERFDEDREQRVQERIKSKEESDD